jgi:hypothetical protein
MKIAVWYHCILSGGTIPVDTPYACAIMDDQMAALSNSGLMVAAGEFHVGINGSESDRDIARLFVRCSKVQFHLHGSGVTSEIPTLSVLREWLPEHQEWYVLYHHIKGVTHPNEDSYTRWRKRMEKAVVWNWRDCVKKMDAGIESCGAHWLTPEQFPGLVKFTPFWGGTFFWATAKFLSTLPALSNADWGNRFDAEKWIGSGPRRPTVHDYNPGWP